VSAYFRRISPKKNPPSCLLEREHFY